MIDYLFMYRTTPHASTGKTPAQLMFGRPIKDKIPIKSQVMEPRAAYEEARESNARWKEQARVYADDKRRAVHNEIQVEDKAIVKNMFKENKLTPTFAGAV